MADHSPFEAASDDGTDTGAETEAPTSGSEGGSAPVDATQAIREIPEALAKRYSGRAWRSKLYLQAYQYGWDHPYSESVIGKLMRYLEKRGIEPVPQPPPTEKQALAQARMSEFASRLRENSMPHKAKPKSHRVRETDPDKLNIQLEKLAKRMAKIQNIIPQRPPRDMAIIEQRKALFAQVRDDIQTVPVPVPVPQQPTHRAPVKPRSGETFEPKALPVRRRRPRKIIEWEAAPSEAPSEAPHGYAPSEASTLDLSAEFAVLEKYQH